jgi:dipeptidyl aminopeptidase/acylaminoacyl peptidase
LPTRIFILVLIAACGAASASARPGGVSSSPFVDCSDTILTAAQPTQAPDGAIVYAAGDDLRSVQADGTGLTTLYRSDSPIGAPDVSPDGRLIAFDRRSLREIWVMNRDGSDAHFVTAGTTPSFSPDSRHLAIGGAVTTIWYVELDVVDLDGSDRRPVAFDANPFPEPSWSPDGTRIAFGSFIATFPPHGVPVIRIDGADGSGERSRGTGSSPRWSPDGTEIAYTDDSDANVPATIQVFKVDGDPHFHRVGPRGRLFDAISPAWSLIGGQLTFLLATTGYQSEEGLLWRIDANGRGRHPIASGCVFGTGSADRIRGSLRADRIYSLEGNDLIDVRGGRRDVVDCGPGRDSVRADRHDVIGRNCERVRRSR